MYLWHLVDISSHIIKCSIRYDFYLEYIQKTYQYNISLPVHDPSLQLADSEALPEQSLPPPNGFGLLHERARDLVP